MKKVTKTKRNNKSVSKSVVRKFEKKPELELTLGLFLGVVAMAIAMLSLVTPDNVLSLSALSLGAVAVWLSFRRKHYHVIFSGMAAMFVSLMGLSVYLNSVSGY